MPGLVSSFFNPRASWSSSDSNATTEPSTSTSSSTTTLDTINQSDRWFFSSSTVRFTPDIGMHSGRMIHALGKTEIKMLRWVWARYRRRVIDSHFPHDDDATVEGLDEMYDDLIDFLRDDLYNEKLNNWACQLLLAQIDKGVTLEFDRALKRTPDCVQLLALFNLCSTSWEPVRSKGRQSGFSYFIQPFVSDLLQVYGDPLQISNMLEAVMLQTLVSTWISGYPEYRKSAWITSLRQLGKSVNRAINTLDDRDIEYDYARLSLFETWQVPDSRRRQQQVILYLAALHHENFRVSPIPSRVLRRVGYAFKSRENIGQTVKPLPPLQELRTMEKAYKLREGF